MTERPQVSVVIAAWNAAPFLARAVESALAGQGVGAVEVLIVDDCSTDNTVAVAEGLARVHPQVRVLRNARNSGPARSRNAGIAAAQGAWIAVLDADDAFAPGRLARMIAVAEAEGFEAVADLPVLYDLAADQAAPEQLPASGSLSRLTLSDLLRPDPETGLDLGLMKPVYHRSLAERGLLRYPEGIRHGEDHRLYVELLRRGVGFGLLREAHYIFSTRIGAISGAYSPGSVTNVDYRAIARQNAGLAEELRATGELTPEIEGLLAARQSQALRQNRIYGWTTLRKRDWPRLKRWLGQEGNARDLGWVILKKLAGQRGLPD
ncbi:glycosyltransferase family 2 protein [Tabrizicola sp. J26]|uniref:glycosyltransferase family 2 protein n=1 Tax=Alitabrizicola rongguiensis TaxID=2909234 RepID=UPI001F3C002B|nr:glycosyltransferase family 2 protein [Tabrizicola rongguiensis]MCF1711087.1 glycosyltransferase family 2 protein [Tabrizicola rongguiensis]